jgi:chitin synthase
VVRFAVLLTVSWLFCIYQLVTKQVGRAKRIKQVLDEATAPKVVVVMPCYREEPAVLIKAIDSVVDCDYPPACINVFLSFDGEQEDELYLNTMETLGVLLTMESYPRKHRRRVQGLPGHHLAVPPRWQAALPEVHLPAD